MLALHNRCHNACFAIQCCDLKAFTLQNASNVEKAFEKFVAPETLSNDNAYKCSKLVSVYLPS